MAFITIELTPVKAIFIVIAITGVAMGLGIQAPYELRRYAVTKYPRFKSIRTNVAHRWTFLISIENLKFCNIQKHF